MKFAGINRGTLRAALILLTGSLICVMVSVFIFTDIGMRSLFKLGVLINSDEVDTSDNIYLEYYDAKKYARKTSGFRIFIGADSSGGYEAALDFLKFAKQNANITTVRLDHGNAEILNSYLESGDTDILSESGLDKTALGYVLAVYNYNAKLPPQKRVIFALGGDCGDGEFMVTRRKYDSTLSKDGVLDICCIYTGCHETDGCDPLFDIGFGGLRFGSLARLEWYVKRIEAVSGNLGFPGFSGINLPQFYFLIAGT